MMHAVAVSLSPFIKFDCIRLLLYCENYDQPLLIYKLLLLVRCNYENSKTLRN